jgi:hypothetical protein
VVVPWSQFDAAHQRHAQIGHQQVDRIADALEQFHGFVAVARFMDAIALAGEGSDEEVSHRGFVLDEQDGFAPHR